MNEFSSLLQQGNAWLFVPSAILLGALHGLEPGHSKTMMAAFIVAIRGTVTQAVLLGLSATISHTAVVWAVAMAGLYFGRNWNTEVTESYFQLASAVLIVGVALWMMWRTWRQGRAVHDHDHAHEHDHSHEHDHPHAHDHGHDESKRIDTGHGVVRLEIFEQGVPPRFRLYRESLHGHHWTAEQVRVETERADGSRQVFTFVQCDGFVESAQEIPEPHEFVARLRLGHEHHSHDYDVEYVEHDHAHHAISDYEGLDVSAPGYQDPHELAHANDIRRRFANRDVTTGQIVVFGLTGGLIPCPASITVLLLCLQLKEVALGAALVLCFSVGLALTMVASGALAALSVKHVSSRWSGFGEFARKAPYFSGVLILCVGFYVGYQGLRAVA
ncbi:MAG TPA: nickel/cobalt efflux protein RcnA [Accumulibacter sp.]|uniref:nickel/cobalt efflux protein RcnA n=1 Tax=Accumulibacter sp. TaxID=2053492 RepID=UPI0025DF2459|nr:nickel/cobalt efflux protein RcnA [Accumulibacter sp.]MCM8598909.1 nickel/cobalt efflux protein RcnA [Accumulibacter sp.]MCM8663192.1 nickel/cobalt efflux protein RcnA [Accumulibacter sp.]HNC51375.1 nickel/cobalt efflux protein RcnA [Accumulibacter sp.]